MGLFWNRMALLESTMGLFWNRMALLENTMGLFWNRMALLENTMGLLWSRMALLESTRGLLWNTMAMIYNQPAPIGSPGADPEPPPSMSENPTRTRGPRHWATRAGCHPVSQCIGGR
ncbi:hypothetical protein MNBD_PLANCTO03-2425 [hydrothermal vent metagenome]|uniref:Uncharacterized protein n=1 Tax=hydrothermal vent metagenome TaxID=652676 RepID=A0A3B1DWG1_9ZZZZ